ncbi:MAG: hypothetical protein ACRCXC_12285 [Legionella sp.]
MSWDQEIKNLQEKKALLKGVICIHESMRLSTQLDAYINNFKTGKPLV